MRPPLIVFAVVWCALAAAPSVVVAQTQCAPVLLDIPVASALASAGFFANLRNADNSIRFLTRALVSESERLARDITARTTGCVPGCAQPVLATVFESTPHVTLARYREETACQQLLAATQASPISYANRNFQSKAEAAEWFNDLTQGDGADGEDLYKRCPGRCSPAYSSVTYEHLGEFTVSAVIVCGHARDKSDNRYRLSARLRWVCP